MKPETIDSRHFLVDSPEVFPPGGMAACPAVLAECGRGNITRFLTVFTRINSWLGLFCLGVLLVSSPVQAQNGRGTILFSNKAGSVNAPVFDYDGITPLGGPQFVAQLWVGLSAFILDPVTPPVAFRSGSDAGFWTTIPSAVVVLPIQAGTKVFAQVRVWERDGGDRFEEAAANGAKVAMSRIIEVFLGGLGQPPTPPALLYGLESFQFLTQSRLLPRITSNPPAQIEMTEAVDSPSLSIQVNGTEPVSFGWYHNGRELRGETNSVLKLSSRLDSAGDYQASVRNQNGSVLGDLTRVRVSPLLEVQPQDLRLSGDSRSNRLWFSARSRALQIQWFKDGNPLTGGNSEVLQLENNASATGRYWVVLSGQFSSVTSRVAVVERTMTDLLVRLHEGRDLDGDGQGDLLFQHADGSVGVWLMQSGRLKRASLVGKPSDPAAGWKVIGSARTGQESGPGILLQSDSGLVAYWGLESLVLKRGLLLGQFGSVPVGAITLPDAEGFGTLVAEKRTSDGVIRTGTIGDGPNPLTPGAEQISALEASGRIVGAGWSRSSGVRYLLEQGTGGQIAGIVPGSTGFSRAEVVPGNPGAGWRLAAVSDLDGDGESDLIFELEFGFVAAWWMKGLQMQRAGYLDPLTAGPGWRLVGPR